MIYIGTQYQPDGLPNITGAFRMTGNGYSGGAYFNGCFYNAGGTYACETQDDYRMRCNNIGINASLSSSIYGKSDFVQPKNVSMLPILKY